MIQLPRSRESSSIVVPSKKLNLQWCEGVNGKAAVAKRDAESESETEKICQFRF